MSIFVRVESMLATASMGKQISPDNIATTIEFRGYEISISLSRRTGSKGNLNRAEILVFDSDNNDVTLRFSDPVAMDGEDLFAIMQNIAAYKPGETAIADDDAEG